MGCLWLALTLVGAITEVVDPTPVEEARSEAPSIRWITGVVQHPDGRPASRALVVCAPSGLVEHALAVDTPVRTSRSGRFATGAWGDESCVVIATAAEDESRAPSRVVELPPRARADDVAAGTRDLVLVLEPGSTIVGRVTDDEGRPVRRFQIAMVDASDERATTVLPRTRWHYHDVVTDDGSFELRGVPRGTWEVRVAAEDHVPAEPARFVLPAEGLAAELVLARGAALSGIVVDASGAPVEGAVVTARRESETFEESLARMVLRSERTVPRSFAPREECTSGADGRFELDDLPAGPVLLRAESEGHADSIPRRVELVPGQRDEDVRIELRRGATIRGVVRDSAGNPLRGIDVALHHEDDTTLRKRTGPNGKFRFDHVTPCEVFVVAEDNARKGRTARLEPRVIERSFVVADGASVDLALGGDAAPRLHVTGVLSVEGRPVADAKLRFILTQSGLADVVVRTGAAGEYAADFVAPGEYWLVGLLPSGSWAERTVMVSEDASQVVDLVLPGTSLRGRVLDPSGAPLVADIVLRRTDLESSVGGWSSITSDESYADGSFVFEALDPGPWRMRVQAQSAADPPLATAFVALDVAPGARIEDLVVRLQHAGSIGGVVRGEDGEPVAGARVTARAEDGLDHDDETLASERIATDLAGRYRLDGLAPGEWRVRAVSEDRASAESAAVRVESGALASADLVLAPGAFVEVALESADGARVPHGPGEWVRVVDAEGRAWIDLDAEDFGELVREHGPLPPGRWTVRRGDGGSFAPVEVDLAAGEREQVTLRARR